MATKDLNLSLDPSLGSPESTPNNAMKQRISTNSPSKFPLLAASVIALANMLFLLFAGLWLQQQAQQITAKPSYVERLDAQLTDVRQQLLALQQRGDALQQQSSEQQLRISSSHADIRRQIKLSLRPPSDSASEVADKQAAPPPQPEDWHVNLGTFSSEGEARVLQQQVAALGHTAKIRAEGFENTAVFQLSVAGFKDQAAAETATRKIMESTELSGLWVWQAEQ